MLSHPRDAPFGERVLVIRHLSLNLPAHTIVYLHLNMAKVITFNPKGNKRGNDEEEMPSFEVFKPVTHT